MLRQIKSTFPRLIILLVCISLFFFSLPRLITALYASMRLFQVENAPAKPVAIVFGAGLWRDGSPSPVLRDRIETAAALYFSGKVKKLLMSGDNRFLDYNEPGAMQRYALDLGIPEKDIVLDYAGRRTYDTCYRAREIFGVKEAILITQGFHLPRALFTCNMLGVNAVGVPASFRSYSRRLNLYWSLRELPATTSAFWEVFISQPIPVLGKPEPIFPGQVQL